MRGLTAPPKEDAPSRALARILMLLVLLAAAGIAIYTAVVLQQIDLVEDTRADGVALTDPSVVDGLTINVVRDEGGADPVVILHDVDVTGGLLLGDISATLPEGYHGVRVDMAGFGYSERVPRESQVHTAAGMADVMAGVLEERFTSPVPIVGIGFGGEVAAELAHTYPNLVSGVVLVDVDFWARPPLLMSVQRLPWVGTAATYTWSTGGRFAVDQWSRYCDDGGWCPTRDQIGLRSFIVSIEDTTNSLHEFFRTHDAAVAPANLGEITAPVAYVWSRDGVVPMDTVERIEEDIPGLIFLESPTYQAHLEDPATVAAAVRALSG